MSTRLSYFSISPLSAVGFQRIADKISNESFGENNASGFIISRRTTSSVEGRYVQKISDVVKIVDPFGNNVEYPRITFWEQRFHLRTKSPQLILFNPVSAAESMLGRLLEYADFKITTEPIEIPLDKLLKSVSAAFENVHVYAVSMEPLELDDSSTAHILVESSTDARSRAKAFLKPRQIAFSNLRCEFEYATKIRRCELKSKGVLTIYGDCDPILEERFNSIVSRIYGQASD